MPNPFHVAPTEAELDDQTIVCPSADLGQPDRRRDHARARWEQKERVKRDVRLARTKPLIAVRDNKGVLHHFDAATAARMSAPVADIERVNKNLATSWSLRKYRRYAWWVKIRGALCFTFVGVAMVLFYLICCNHF